MRKLFLVAVAAMMLAGCGKEGYDWGSKEEPQTGNEYGKVTLSVNEGNTVYVKSESITEANGDYLVETLNSSSVQVSALSGTYSNLKGQTITVPVGSYTITSQNITASQAEAAYEGMGAAHYFGKSSFAVSASATPSNVSVICTMANAKVTFDYDETFTNMFNMASSTQVPTIVATPSNSLTAGRSVTFTGDVNHDGKAAYFTVASTGTTLSFTITAARLSDGVVKSYTSTTPVSLAAKTWHKVKIAASSNNGQAQITINVDGTIIEAEEEITVDPYAVAGN